MAIFNSYVSLPEGRLLFYVVLHFIHMPFFHKSHQSTTAGTASHRGFLQLLDCSFNGLIVTRDNYMVTPSGNQTWLGNPQTQRRFIAWEHQRTKSGKFIEHHRTKWEIFYNAGGNPILVFDSNLHKTPNNWTPTHKITQNNTRIPSLGVAGGRFDQGFSFVPSVPEGENVSSPAVERD